MRTFIFLLSTVMAFGAQAVYERSEPVVKVVSCGATAESLLSYESRSIGEDINGGNTNFDYAEIQSRAANFAGAATNQKDFESDIAFAANNPNLIRFVTDSEFNETSDEFTILPTGCALRELVLRSNGYYLISQPLWDKMSAHDQALVYAQIGVQVRAHDNGKHQGTLQEARSSIRALMASNFDVFSVLSILDRLYNNLHFLGVRIIVHDADEGILEVRNTNAFITTNMGAIDVSMLAFDDDEWGSTTFYYYTQLTVKGSGVYKIEPHSYASSKSLVANGASFIADARSNIYLYENGNVCSVKVTSNVSLEDDQGNQFLISTPEIFAFDSNGKLVTSGGQVITGNVALAHCEVNY